MINNKSINNELELHNFIEEKIKYIQEIIRSTIISIKKNTYYEIFSNNDINLSISVLNEIYSKTKDIMKSINKHSDKTIDSLQKIIDKLSMLICGFGTKRIEDLLFISFGSEFKNIKISDPKIQSKYDLICEYVQPTGYKVINWKQLKLNSQNDELCCNKITDDIIKLEDANMFECFDLEKTNHNFYQKIHGIRVIIQNEKQKKTLVINGIIEDIDIECFSNLYIDYRILELKQIANAHQENEKKIINRIIETLSLKDILIYGNNDIQKKVISVLTEVNSVKQSKIDIIVKKFLDLDN